MPSVEIHAPDSQQDTTKPPRSVEIWGRTWQGIDEGDHVASWFTDFLGTSLRLVRFAPDQRRLSAPEWTGTVEAENSFSDGFPILVLSRASLDELNGRLLGPPIPMNRFRPNIVLDGVTAYFEDHHPTLSNSAVELRMVKPCTRCQITTVNQDTAESGREPLRTLSTYRRDERLAGITFGQNAIILRGFGEMLHLGMEFAPSLRPH